MDKLIEDFKSGLFDESRTLIPVDKNYELIDGAHRVSCAAYFNKKVRILRFLDVKIYEMTFQYLTDKLMPMDVAEAMALEATKWHDDLFMLFLWPKAFLQGEKLSKAKELIKEKADVLYHKPCVMSYQAIRNLMIQIYGHMDWVGNIDNDFSSTYKKADEVWSPEGKCEFVLLKAPSTQYVLNLKSEIREIFQIGLSSIHSTDNMRETVIAANALFNPNSFFFLNIAKPTRFKNSYRLLQKYKSRIHEGKRSENEFIVDSSMVLAITGAREANDLDFYTTTEKGLNLFNGISNIEEHDNIQRQYYNVPISDLITNSHNHFWYDEIKFVSLEQLLEFKKNRYKADRDPKDASDIKLLEILLSGKENKFRKWILSVQIGMRRSERKFMSRYRTIRNSVLKRVGIYDHLKMIKDQYKKYK